jgi:hypothetical protein
MGSLGMRAGEFCLFFYFPPAKINGAGLLNTALLVSVPALLNNIHKFALY